MFEGFSLSNETQDSMSKCDFNYKLYELLAQAQGPTGLTIKETYSKNVDLLLSSLKIDRQMPNLEKLKNLCEEIFSRKCIFLFLSIKIKKI